MDSRQKSNLKIIEIITNHINSYPDIRFNQALIALNITNCDNTLEFYEEPEVTLERMLNEAKKQTWI